MEYYEEFQDWDGSTGAFLKFGENIKTVAQILLNSDTGISNFVKKSQISTSNLKKGKVKSTTRSLF